MANSEWLAQLQAGDLNALPRLLEYLELHLRAELRKELRRGVEMHDVLAETLMKAVDGVKRLRDRSAPHGYLHTIAKRIARRESEASKGALSLSPFLSLSADRRRRLPETASERLDRKDLVSWLIADLPSSQRKLIDLVFFQGLSPPEAQEALGLTPGAFRVAKSRLLAKLRKKSTALSQG